MELADKDLKETGLRASRQKRSYVVPELLRYGTLAEMTQGKTGTKSDGFAKMQATS